MEKSNYTDTLELLNKDKSRLNAELELIEVAIRALTTLSNGIDVTLGASVIKKDITNGSAEKKQRKNYFEDVTIKIVNTYDPEYATLEQLIFALKEIKSGTIEEITDHIVKIDSTKEYAKIFPRFRDTASGLYRAGKINADTTRKKYKYSLKKEDIDKYEEDNMFS